MDQSPPPPPPPPTFIPLPPPPPPPPTFAPPSPLLLNPSNNLQPAGPQDQASEGGRGDDLLASIQSINLRSAPIVVQAAPALDSHTELSLKLKRKSSTQISQYREQLVELQSTLELKQYFSFDELRKTIKQADALEKKILTLTDAAALFRQVGWREDLLSEGKVILSQEETLNRNIKLAEQAKTLVTTKQISAIAGVAPQVSQIQTATRAAWECFSLFPSLRELTPRHKVHVGM